MESSFLNCLNLQPILTLLLFLASISSLRLSDTIKYQIEPHPNNLMCTIYVKLGSKLKYHIYDQLIRDNHQSSILSLTTNESKTVPPPSITFLEKCTVNVVVLSIPFDTVLHLGDNFHSIRSHPHAIFIIIADYKCDYYPFRVGYNQIPRLFYHFTDCPQNDRSIFPNGFINNMAVAGDLLPLQPINPRKPISIYTKHIPHYLRLARSWVYVHSSLKPRKFDNKYMKIFWAPLSNLRRYGHTDPYTVFLFELKQYFNLSFTWNRAYFRVYSSGFFVVNAFDRTEARNDFFLYKYANWVAVVDDTFVTFVNCVPKKQKKLLSVDGFFSPFSLITWIVLVAAVCFAIRIYGGDADSFIIRCLLDQDIEISRLDGIILSFGVLIVTTCYKTQVTSDLLVTQEPELIKDINTLISKGYTFLYDRTISNVVHEMIAESSYDFKNTTRMLNTQPLLPYESENSASYLYGKCFTTFMGRNELFSHRLHQMNTLLVNMSCTVTDNYLEKNWYNYRFSHPLSANMVKFTNTAKEMGLFSFFEHVIRNRERVLFNKINKDRVNLLLSYREKQLFISFSQAITIFLSWLFLVLGCTIVFLSRKLKHFNLVTV